MKVYEEKWSAKSRDYLIWCIKMMQKEIDQDIVIKMFDHLFVRMSSYGEWKWVTMPSENLKWINLYVYLARKLDINAFS